MKNKILALMATVAIISISPVLAMEEKENHSKVPVVAMEKDVSEMHTKFIKDFRPFTLQELMEIDRRGVLSIPEGKFKYDRPKKGLDIKNLMKNFMLINHQDARYWDDNRLTVTLEAHCYEGGPLTQRQIQGISPNLVYAHTLNFLRVDDDVVVEN